MKKQLLLLFKVLIIGALFMALPHLWDYVMTPLFEKGSFVYCFGGLIFVMGMTSFSACVLFDGNVL